MKYPTVEDIFLNFELNSEAAEKISELNRAINKYLDRLIGEKKLSEEEADRIRDAKSELEFETRLTGFKQGFYFALNLFMNAN